MPTKSNEVLIVRAAELGDSTRVRSLLKGGVSPNASAPRQEGEIFGGVIAVRLGIPVFSRVGFWDVPYPTITALQAAAGGGHEEAVQILIEAGASVNMPGADSLGRTALQAAAEGGQDEIVRLLLEYKADVNARASKYHGISALQGAAGNGHAEIVKLLLAAKADVNALASEAGGRTALQAAAGYGHVGIVRLLLDVKADANALALAPEYGGRTALQAAAGKGRGEIVRLLLEAGADVNAVASEGFGRTALQAAAENGHGEVVQLLLKANADVNAPASKDDGKTALQAAAGNGHEEVVRWLLEAEADVNADASEGFGRTALQAAAESGHGRIVELLLAANAEVNASASEREGRTALQAAAENGHEEVVQLLLNTNADVNAPASEDDGKTALQAAAGNGHLGIVKLLLDAKADTNTPVPGYGRRTALQAAAGNGHCEIVRLLLGAGADVNADASEGFGRTALQAAAENGRREIVQLLLAANAEVNAPASKGFGRTALQAAAENGHEEVVQLLLEATADANAPASEDDGRTALQAAAGNGHEEIVRRLLAAEADVNAPASEGSGRTAIQAAAERGHRAVVKLLLQAQADANAHPSRCGGKIALCGAAGNGHVAIVRLLLGAKANVNTPASGYGGRTALQAAAGNGRGEIVRLLLAAKADVNARASEGFGRTALQAAAEGGHDRIVQLLLAGGADVNAPASEHEGRTALQAAAERGHRAVIKLLLEAEADANALPSRFGGRRALCGAAENGYGEIVQLLLEAGADANARSSARNRGGALTVAVERGDEEVARHLLNFGADANLALDRVPMIHIAASNKAIHIAELLLNGGANPNRPNYLGETVLHEAVRTADVNWLRSLLDLKVFDTDAPNPRGQTPLQLTLEARPDNFDEICALLLARGASTDGLSVDILPWAGGDNEVVFLEQNQEGGKSMRYGPPGCSLRQSGERSSVCLLHLESRTRNSAPKFFHPGAYISDSRARGIVFPEAEAVVEFRWMNRRGELNRRREYIPGVPVLRDGGFEGWLIGYVSFNSFIYGGCGDGVQPSFKVTDRKLGISWIMTNHRPGSGESGMLRKPLRSVHYRGSLAHLSIPAHCVEFFTWLLRDVRQNWEELLSKSESYLADRNRALVGARGEDPTLIHSLLEAKLQWSTFFTRLRLHVSKSRDLLRDFESNAAFYQEVLDFECKQQASQAAPAGQSELSDTSQDCVTPGLWPKPLAIVGLAILIEEMEKILSDRISDLERRTAEMIDWEFSLAAIYQARRSNRFSWVTAMILFPLMFTAALFGMNVDLLKADPSWIWYLAFALLTLAFVFGIWVAFEYTDIEKWARSNIGRCLKCIQALLGNRRSLAARSSTLGAGVGSGNIADLDAPSMSGVELRHPVGAGVANGRLNRRRLQLDADRGFPPGRRAALWHRC